VPHVIIEGPCSVRSYWERFQTEQRRDDDRIVKAINAYLSRDSSTAMVECMVAEGFLRQTFLAQLIQREHGVLIRLSPSSTPERTEGVRFCLAWIAAALARQDPSCRWGAHNLGIPIPPPC